MGLNSFDVLTSQAMKLSSSDVSTRQRMGLNSFDVLTSKAMKLSGLVITLRMLRFIYSLPCKPHTHTNE
jgi:hypothetical protein